MIGALFPLERKEKRRKEKTNHHVEGGFALDWTHLAGCVVGHGC
jgi:hypothetical protein